MKSVKTNLVICVGEKDEYNLPFTFEVSIFFC